MSLFQFYAHNSREALTLIGQHLYLVAVSTGIALAVGVPGGVLLTRRPAWRGPVLGIANVLQTIPSLALFGFLIPLPFIGGIGARTAIVALVVYALLPIVRNTYTGIAGVDPAVREAGRGTGMTGGQRRAAGAETASSWGPRTSRSPICWPSSSPSRSSAARDCRSTGGCIWAGPSCVIARSPPGRSGCTWSTPERRSPRS